MTTTNIIPDVTLKKYPDLERMDVAIDQVWSLKEEPSRANNWKNEEVAVLLNAIKAHNLMKGSPSITQLGHLLEPLMGYSRTAFQITGKLKNLRKSYLTCEKKGCTPNALRECPYYDMLADVYGHEADHDSDTNNTTNEPEDIKVSSEQGIEKMLTVIKDLNLASDLTLQSFSGSAIRLISKMLIARGVCASIEQVKSTLIDLRKAYIEYRQSSSFGTSSTCYSYFDYLHTLWGSMPIPDFFTDITPTNAKQKTEMTPRERGDQWTEEETIVLLTSIKALDLTDEASKNTEDAARKLKAALKDSGYVRSKYHIQRRLDNLHNSYLQAQLAKTAEEAIRKFPFYHLYEGIFGLYSSDDISNSGNADAMDEIIAGEPHIQLHEDDSIVFTEKTKHSRSRSWSDEETILMLSLLKELNLVRLIAQRLSFEIACKLVEPLREHGYTRSAMQIQIKLRNLRKGYYRCIRAGNTEKAIGECPFYHKLNAIFRKPRDRKLRTFRKLKQVGTNYVNVPESFTDHSYFNAVSQEKPCKVPKLERDSDGDQDSREVWLPVETICDDDSGTVHEEGDASAFDEVDDTEMYASNEDDDAADELEDPLEEDTAQAGNDTGQSDDTQDSPNNGYSGNLNDILVTTCEIGTPGPSNASSGQGGSSSRCPTARKTRRNLTNSYSPKTTKDSPTLKSMRIVMAEVLRHEKLLQRQHHIWMERQFEIQRKHDREQRESLIKELEQFRKAVTSTMPKQEVPNSEL